MEYTYTLDVFVNNARTRKTVTTKFDKVIEDLYGFSVFNVEVFDNVKSRVVGNLVSSNDIKSWQDYLKGAGVPPTWILPPPASITASTIEATADTIEAGTIRVAVHPFFETVASPNITTASVETAYAPAPPPPVKKDPSNPDHYKHYMKNMQWLEVILEVYKDEPEKVLGFLEIQISKYLSRIGKKDPYLQDAKKLRWYSIFLTAYADNGCKPIKIENYPALKG